MQDVIEKIRTELKANFANVSLSNTKGRCYKVTVGGPLIDGVCNGEFVTDILRKYDLDIKNVTVDTNDKVVVMCKPGEPDLQIVDDEILAFWANYAIGGSGMGIPTQRTLRNMARMIFDKRGVDYTKVEYRLGNFDGTGRVAVVIGNHEVVRYEDEAAA